MTDADTEAVGNTLSRLGYEIDPGVTNEAYTDLTGAAIFSYKGPDISFLVIECDTSDVRNYHEDFVGMGIKNPQTHIETDYETTSQRWDNGDLDFLKRAGKVYDNFLEVEVSEMGKLRDSLCSDGFEAHLYWEDEVGEEGIPYMRTID